MSLASNIARRAGSASYYARLAVPKDLQLVVGRKELWESLLTKDAREARARIGAVLARWHAEFDALRRRREATEDDFRAATWAHYQEELAQHILERRQLKTETEIQMALADLIAKVQAGEVDLPESEAGRALLGVDINLIQNLPSIQTKFREARKRTIQQHLACNETVLVRDAVDAVVAREGFDLERGSPGYRDLAQRFQRAELEALRRAEEHDRGDFTGRPVDAVVVPSKGSAMAVAGPGEGVMELFEVFARENPRHVKVETIRMNREIVGWFAQHVGLSFPAKSIDKRAVREWKQALAKFPVKAVEVRAFRGMTFKQIIAENAKVGRPVLSDRTVNKYLSALGAFCQWLMQNGHLESNPVLGMHLGKERGRTKVRPYTSEELTTLFSSPLFTGCLSVEEAHLPGNVRFRDHRYWLPLLSLYTGARMGELAQLLVADVRQERGRWIVHVTREGDEGKTTKTAGSQRVIPVHPELQLLGFLAFHAVRQQAGNRRLFPEIEPDARGNLAGNYSRWWGRYVIRIGVKHDKTLNFHSFRHGMADALRRAGYRDEEFGFLLGHTKATTTGRYGILSEGDLAQRCKMIDAVSFPDLDLQHLYQI